MFYKKVLESFQHAVSDYLEESPDSGKRKLLSKYLDLDDDSMYDALPPFHNEPANAAETYQLLNQIDADMKQYHRSVLRGNYEKSRFYALMRQNIGPKIDALCAEMSLTFVEQSNRISTLQKSFIEQSRERQRLAEALKDERGRLASLLSERSELEDELSVTRERSASLADDKEDAQRSVSEAEHQIALLQADNDKANHVIDVLSKQLHDSSERFKLQNGVMVDEVKSLSEQLSLQQAEHEQVLQQKETQLAKSKQHNHILQQKLVHLVSQNKSAAIYRDLSSTATGKLEKHKLDAVRAIVEPLVRVSSEAKREGLFASIGGKLVTLDGDKYLIPTGVYKALKVAGLIEQTLHKQSVHHITLRSGYSAAEIKETIQNTLEAYVKTSTGFGRSNATQAMYNTFKTSNGLQQLIDCAQEMQEVERDEYGTPEL